MERKSLEVSLFSSRPYGSIVVSHAEIVQVKTAAAASGGTPPLESEMKSTNVEDDDDDDDYAAHTEVRVELLLLLLHQGIQTSSGMTRDSVRDKREGLAK